MMERGFMPFSLAGVVLVVLVLGMLGQSVWVRHRVATESIDEERISELSKLDEEVRGNLRALLKRSVNQALAEICENAEEFSDGGRRWAAGWAAARYFSDGLRKLAETYPNHDNRVELQLPEYNRIVEISEAENGYVVARATMPPESRLVLHSWDNSVRVEVPLGEVKTLVDARYFLLQERMGQFIERKEEVCAIWQAMEYVRGWGEAWLGGKVHLDETIDRALFQSAWAVHEYNSFGSCDYWGTALEITGSAREVLSGGTVAVSPVSASDIRGMVRLVDEALDAVGRADSLLDDLSRNLSRAKELLGEENLPIENLRISLDAAVGDAQEARSKVFEVQRKFNELLTYVSQRASGDVMMETLHGGLTTRFLSDDLPSPEEQVEWCVGGIERVLSEIGDMLVSVPENLASVELGEILNSGKATAEGLRLQPAVCRWVVVEVYVDDPPREVENRIPVYVGEDSGQTIPTLKVVLEGLKNNMNDIRGIPEELGEVEVKEIPGLDGWLREKLTASPPALSLDRENLYRVFPPPPVNPRPGISVFHELDIRGIDHMRGDLAGQFGSPWATPIPLPFLNIVLYWGQWDTTIEVGEAVEEILDFENPTILRPSELGYVHAPLAYRWELPQETYGIRVVVISLKPFEIG